MSNKRIKTDFIVVHSSQTTPEQNFTAEDIAAMHRKEGLLNIGFHKIITREGKVEDGRHIDIAGIHVDAKGDVSNANSIGICSRWRLRGMGTLLGTGGMAQRRFGRQDGKSIWCARMGLAGLLA